MKPTRLYLIRHGQVVGHDEYRYNGHSDVDITEVGLLQMNRLADFLRDMDFSAVYSSDLQRASKGAGIIAGSLGLRKIEVHALRELHLGRWEGLTREEAVALYPEDRSFSFRKLATDRVQGGESLLELKERVMPAVTGVIEKNRGRSVCIVAHGGVNRVILCDAMGLSLEKFFHIEQDYGCLNVIDYFEDGIKVVKLLNGGPNQDLHATKLY